MSALCHKQTSAHRRRSAWLTIGAMTWRIENYASTTPTA
jgi:hypothetical protein